MSTTSGQHDTRASDAAYESGNGTPLVLLHGLGGNEDGFFDNYQQ